MFSKIVSKVVMDKRVLGGCREEVLFFILTVLGFVGGDVGEDIKTIDWGGGDWGASDDIIGAVGGVERKTFDIVESGPDRSGGWGILELGGLRSGVDRLEDMSSDVKRAWIVPSVVRTLKDLKDGGSGVGDILLIYVIEGQPESNRDVGEGRGGDDGGL